MCFLLYVAPKNEFKSYDLFKKKSKVKNILETKYQKTWTVIATISSLLIKHASNISDKIFHLHHHHHIKSGVEHFLVRNQNICLSTCHQTRIFENMYTANNTANNINETSENNSDAESCVSTESKVSKAKWDRWNTQQTGVLVNMWKDHYKELESNKQTQYMDPNKEYNWCRREAKNS